MPISDWSSDVCSSDLAGDRIGSAWPRGDVDYREPVGQAIIGLRRHRQRLFVMRESRRQRGMRAERMVEVHRPSPRQHEHIGNTLVDERLGDPVGEFEPEHFFHTVKIAVRRITAYRETVGETLSDGEIGRTTW